MLKDQTFVARAHLSEIIKEIMPLLKQHSGSLTPDYLRATVALYQRMQDCWDSIDPALKGLDEATPHVLFLQ